MFKTTIKRTINFSKGFFLNLNKENTLFLNGKSQHCKFMGVQIHT